MSGQAPGRRRRAKAAAGGQMSRKMLALGCGLLVCLLVAPTVAARAAAALSPRDVSIVGGQWTWASGSNRSAESDPYGVYGTKGLPAPENTPGARLGSVDKKNQLHHLLMRIIPIPTWNALISSLAARDMH